jgi:hypothetical protein
VSAVSLEASSALALAEMPQKRPPRSRWAAEAGEPSCCSCSSSRASSSPARSSSSAAAGSSSARKPCCSGRAGEEAGREELEGALVGALERALEEGSGSMWMEEGRRTGEATAAAGRAAVWKRLLR